jgi:hypothetical protein
LPTAAIWVAEIAPAVVIVIRPLALRLARFNTWPAKVIVGSPETPLPLEMDRPAPETAIERPVMAVEDVFTWKPVPDATKDDKAPVVVTLNTP